VNSIVQHDEPGRETAMSAPGLILRVWPFFSLLALGLYWQALDGPFISDDMMYIVVNPWTETLSFERVAGIFDPTGEARFSVVNYAPLALLASAVERAVFWDNPLGYHVVNVLVHALNATLLAALLVRAGLALTPALFGALLFLVHPGNVEAVAWISQLKTLGALAFALGSLLAFGRHPMWATLLFVAGLLTKASAAMALPMATALVWCRAKGPGTRTAWAWLACWLVLFLLYSVPQTSAIHPRGTVEVPAYEDAWVHLRTIASVGVHYLVTAYTALGVAHAKEHPPVFSMLYPWWLAAIPLTAFFVWRIATSLRRRELEGVYWIGAAAAFAPVSQFLPFSHPIADRYLYFLLPGLLGGTLLLVYGLTPRLRQMALLDPPWLRRAGALALTALLLTFANLTVQRARLWTDQTLLMADSARSFPAGRVALVIQARRHAQAGDAAQAVTRLREAVALGHDQFQVLMFDQGLAPIAHDPLFRGLIGDLAGRYIERVESLDRPTTGELGAVSRAHFERGEFDAALTTLERAANRGGVPGRVFAEELEHLHALLAEIEGGSGATSGTPGLEQKETWQQE